MKYLLLSAVLSLCVISASADERSRVVLDLMTSKIAGYSSYQVDFTATMGGGLESESKGRLIVSGDKYYVEVNDYELFFDGKLRYTYSYYDGEVVIENNDPADNNLLSNPSRFFKLTDDDFSHESKDPGLGRSIDIVELSPKKKNAGYKSILLQVNPETRIPETIIYYGDANSMITTIRIDKFTPNVQVSPSTFTFDRGKYPDAEVIDFRRNR